MRAFLSRGLRWFVVLSIIVMFVEVVVEVSCRFVLKAPIPWGAELSQTVLVWLTFVGAAAAFLKGDHIAINMFGDALRSKVAKTALRAINTTITLAFVAVACRSGWQVVERTWEDTTQSLGISAGIMYLALPFGMALILLLAVMALSGRNGGGQGS
jgi:TRAP-type C4-dicarboxylate transport system permease small subunit